jgi:2'-5' RNA ligase
VTAAAVRVRRLFFGLWPDAATREALRRATRALVRDCGGRPVPPENYHLTLAFLGNVADEHVDAIVNAGRGLSLAPLTLTLDQFGYFPAPQVLWIGPVEAPEPLRQLAVDIWLALDAAGVPPEARLFHPHVSLARKVPAPPDLSPPRPVAWPVSGFALMESDTDPDGARYRVVASFPA